MEDAAYKGLSALGDHSGVWLGAAAASAFFGGPRGRRAAAEVLAALGLSSFAANVVVKLGFRRRRPVAELPILVRRPRSRSFPSGHSATSFAAATVLAARYRPLAPVALAVAGGVAVSRVYVGVHYPIDVGAGAAVGSVIGAGVIVAQRPFREPALTAEELETLGEGLRAAVVVNPSAGSSVGALPEPVAVRELSKDEELRDVLAKLVADGVDIIGIAGGDGSVGGAARVALENDRVLWVVPGGTLNHFAKTLGAGDVAAAVRVLESGRVAKVDVGEVSAGDDDITFVNAASLGAYADLVRRRERYEATFKMGRWPALALALMVTFRRPEPLDVEVDGVRERALLVFVGNNPYHGTVSPRGRESLQTGLLELRVVRWRGDRPRWSIVVALLARRLESSGVMVRRLVEEVSLKVDGPVALGHDGEVTDVDGELVFRSRPRALKVLVSP